jgi:hypothetical protein
MKHAIPKLHLLLCYVVFIAHTLADPSEEVLNKFIAHRRPQREARQFLERPNAYLQSRPVITVENPESLQVLSSSTQSTTNWAGAVQVSSPSGVFNSVSGQWTIPAVSVPSSASGPGVWYTSQWVGIDGYSCLTSIIQAGIFSYVEVSTSGAVTNAALAWHEWYPNPQVQFSDFSVSAGDTVHVSVKATSKSRGQVVVNNLSKGTSTSTTVSAPSESYVLCGMNAEWIIEDPASDNGLVPFASFTDFSFSNCAATTTTGETVDLTNTQLLQLIQNNVLLATPTQLSSTEIQVSYG